MESKKVIIFDTTLRDGEQAPGCSLGAPEKLQVAEQLYRLGVDVIEAGFPVSSRGDFESVQRIARTIGRQADAPEICGLSRCVKGDIEACGAAVKPAKRPRIHVFIATSDIHLEHKLHMTRAQVLQRAVESVKLARKYTRAVEFSAEDATRSDVAFLVQIFTAVIEAGATTINVPDTTGFAIPSEYGQLIGALVDRIPNVDRAIVSTHCHDDLGLSVANSLAGIKAGVRQVECTINGLGERAGNTSLEEVVMGLWTRKDVFGLSTGIRTREIAKTSRLVSSLTGVMVPPNKAIVGANAFAHSSGIHQDGILKYRQTYEIMNPEDVGIEESSLLLTSRSGRHALGSRLKQLGYRLTQKQLNEMFVKFKTLADKKRYVFDDDLLALMDEETAEVCDAYSLEYLHTSSGMGTVPTATIRVKLANGDIVQEAACGDGPVDATTRAIDKVVGLKPKLVDYNLHAVTSGKDAQGEVTVRIEESGLMILGRGASTDIIEASAKAYLHAINRLMKAKKQHNKTKIQGKV
ncbi:MAG: 2-isopropylmalate synthase [Elusimicrobiota bacterium]|jgi:2-isopropylmalate synthase